MKRILHTLAFGLVLIGMGMGSVQAQQLFRRSQFMTNSFLSNPAIAGTLPETPVTMTFRNQWTGFDGAPETMTLSGHTSLPNNLGIGAIVYSDDTGGAINRTGLEIAGSYTIDLNNYDAVSFGLSVMANQWSFDNDLDVWDVEDPALQYGLEQSLSFDAQFGMMVFGDGYSFGFAIPHLLQSSTGLQASSISSVAENDNFRHFRFMGQYSFQVNNDFRLEPSGMVRLTERTPAQLDVYLRGWYADMAWVALGFRTNDAAIVGVGGQYGPMGLSYTYDITSTSASYFSPHSHEVTLTYFVPRSSGFSSNSMNSSRILGRNRIVK
ncbi:type IX secretion system membrane protein PorP/SprF [Flavobacteriales bacterium]|nr:type IX secretion system membrane protein PorP/SprF [Flavobacteriales bacterium]MDB4493765.1 type IX secretion system membrane protein PorP/SprF [Flavobacteriales bacterium]